MLPSHSTISITMVNSFKTSFFAVYSDDFDDDMFIDLHCCFLFWGKVKLKILF